MPIPAHIWIEGVEGGCTVSDREGSIEVFEFNHEVRIPTDQDTGEVTGTRKHEILTFVKPFDRSTPLLYKAVCEGATLPSVKIVWYRIDDSGTEEEYFFHILENVKICSISSFMYNVKNREYERFVHMDRVGMRYEKITWFYNQGNIKWSDSWLENR